MKKLITVVVAVLMVVGLAVGCGGGGEGSSSSAAFSNPFENTFEGEFFKIGYPGDWQVKEDAVTGVAIEPILDEDTEDENEFNLDMSAVSVQNVKSPETTRGAVDELKTLMEEGAGKDMMGMVEFDTVTVSGEKALKMSMSFFGITMDSYMIPMDGWTITVGKVGSDETAQKILDTFFITNPDYTGSTQTADFGLSDGEDTDSDWNWDDEEEDEDDDWTVTDDDEMVQDLAVGETYEGVYFEITKPEGFTVEDGDPNEVVFIGKDFQFIVMCEEGEQYIWSDTDPLKDELKDEIESGEISKVEKLELGINSALWFEGNADGIDLVMVSIPMTGWLINIVVPGYSGEEQKEEIRSIINTFDVTDMFYSDFPSLD